MDKSVFLDAQVQAKKMHTLLNEVLDLTVQMADAADRGDEITIQLLLGMRADPIEKLNVVRQSLQQLQHALPASDRSYLADLLNGGAAKTPEEEPLAEQVSVNKRLYAQVLSLDQRLNQKVTRDESVYENKTSDVGVEFNDPVGLSSRA